MCYLTAGLLSTASSALTASSPSHLVPLKQAVVQNKGGGSLCLQHANISCRAAHKVAVGDGGCGVADEQVSGRVGLEADQRVVDTQVLVRNYKCGRAVADRLEADACSRTWAGWLWLAQLLNVQGRTHPLLQQSAHGRCRRWQCSAQKAEV